MENRTNLLISQVTSSKVGLVFLYVTVIGLGLAIIAIGSLTFINQAQIHAKLESAKKGYRAKSITAVTSNEKANPGTLAFYLNNEFAGALTDDNAYSPAAREPAEGPLTVLFVNPTDTPLPTTAEFMPQTLKLTSDVGDITICLPRMTGGKTLWISKDGTSFIDQYLTQPARSC